MDKQHDTNGPKEITWEHVTIKQFDVYSHYVHHDCLATSILKLEHPVLTDPQERLLFLVDLYRSGMRLDDSTFANRVLDLMTEIQCVHRVTLYLILRCSNDDLLVPPCKFFIARFVIQCVQERNYLFYTSFKDVLSCNPRHSEIYFDICKAFIKHHVDPVAFTRTFQLKEMYHRHTEGDVCYSEKCNNICQREFSKEHGPAPDLSGGGPGDA